jgi:hypothetical protein
MELVPFPSELRYLCTSKIKLVVEPSRFVTVESAGPEPSVTKVPVRSSRFREGELFVMFHLRCSVGR